MPSAMASPSFLMLVMYATVLPQLHSQGKDVLLSNNNLLVLHYFFAAESGIRLSLNGVSIANNSYVDIDDIRLV